MMDKLKMHSPNMTDSNIAKLAVLFPNCVTECKEENGNLKQIIDFDRLKQELSDAIVEGPHERYQLDWPGKRRALFIANTPIAKTLRPCREESVNFDTTQNLFVQGDNLDALKLIQETYLGQVKMIYIDPPYNTGNDFVYEDKFVSSKDKFMKLSNQEDESGNKLIANKETNGRFHSDWLDMVYPRLQLARNLLSVDGVIVVSIDENEVVNIRKMFDEIFGESNFLFQITLLCNPKGRSQDKFVANCHEYLIGYSKQQLNKGDLNIPKEEAEISKNYTLYDNRGRYRELELRNTHREFGKHNRKNLYYPFFVNRTGDIILNEKPGYETIYPNWDDGFEGCWTWGLDKARQQFNEIVAKKVKGSWKIYRKNYAEDEEGKATKQVKSIWSDKKFHTEKGQTAFNSLFKTKEKIFQSPKSVDTIRQLLLMASNNNSLVLDFFSGSATTAHAVMKLNAEDGGKRKFIMVQLPEPSDESSEAFIAGYKNIADIGKERIRRAGNAIIEEQDQNAISSDNKGLFKSSDSVTKEKLDVGFRVLKVDTSNMSDIYYNPDEVDQKKVDLFTENIKPDRSSEDLLFQVLLDWGVDLSLPITTLKVQRLEVFKVDTNALLACFAKKGEITESFCRELAKDKPLRVVFRDAGFKSDTVKINVEQIFNQLSPATEVKTI
jgi:adenine-specific DNA-methyltransferase